jgi:hypothetical protein
VHGRPIELAGVVDTGFGLPPFLPVVELEHRLASPANEHALDVGFDHVAGRCIRVEDRLPVGRDDLRIAGTVSAKPLVQELELLGRELVQAGSPKLGLRHPFFKRRRLRLRSGDHWGKGQENREDSR